MKPPQYTDLTFHRKSGKLNNMNSKTRKEAKQNVSKTEHPLFDE